MGEDVAIRYSYSLSKIKICIWVLLMANEMEETLSFLFFSSVPKKTSGSCVRVRHSTSDF